MTQEQIVKENEAIADFMGWRRNTRKRNWQKSRINYPTWIQPDGVGHKVLCFHSDWNWLMPVIDDIYYSRRFDTGVQSSEISSKPVRLYANIKHALLNLSISQTHEAVVAFITWYQSQNKINQ